MNCADCWWKERKKERREEGGRKEGGRNKVRKERGNEHGCLFRRISDSPLYKKGPFLL